MRWLALALVGATSLASAQPDDPFGRRARRPSGEPASPCAEPRLGPAAAPLDDTGLDRDRAACTGEAALVALRGLAAIDAPDFYGTLAGALFAELRVATPVAELTVGARLLDYRFAQNAVTTADELGGGPLILGVARAGRPATWFGRPRALVHDLRLSLPFTDSTRRDPAFAAAPSVRASLALSPRLQLHGRMGLLLRAGFPAAGIDARGAAIVGLDGAVALGPVAFALGVVGQAALRDPGLDHLAPRLALRIGRRTRLDLAAVAPLVGDTRDDLAVELALAIDHGGP